MREERSNQIDRLLATLTAMRGVTAAAVVDQDGFVTHVRRDFEINADALGAAVQITYGAAQRSAEHVGHHDAQLVMSENADGMILLAPIVRGFMLAIVADDNAMLGSVRFEVKETIPALGQLFGDGATATRVRVAGGAA